MIFELPQLACFPLRDDERNRTFHQQEWGESVLDPAILFYYLAPLTSA